MYDRVPHFFTLKKTILVVSKIQICFNRFFIIF